MSREQMEAGRVTASDVLLVVGALLLVGGIAAFSWRVAMIVAGILCLGSMWMMERAQSREVSKADTKGQG
jgi:hypothetical protein